MKDPFGVLTSGMLRVTCQIMHVDRLAHGMLIDLVTIEPCQRGDDHIPAGSALALGLRYLPLRAGRRELERAVDRWESHGTVLYVEASNDAAGLRYKFTAGNDELILLVEERPEPT